MHSSDGEEHAPDKKPRWKKCPICWDSIYASETRPVRWFRGQEGDLPVEGGDVVLRLVKREPGSTLALPRDGGETIGKGEDIPWYHVAEVADYSRIMKGGEDYMAAQYDEEIEDLRRQEIEDELLFGDENTWSRKAIRAISDAKDKLKGIGNPPTITRQKPNSKPAKQPVVVPENAQHAAPPGGRSSEDSAPSSSTDMTHPTKESTPTPITSDETTSLTEDIEKIQLGAESKPRSRSKGRGKEPQNTPSSDQPYYFYQALPQFYLSPLDIRILKAAFGEYAQFPATILPRVEHISTGHMVDDDLRKRVKYLGHLPYGCEVNFLECDWRDVVVPEVLARFRTETDRRRKRNRDKEAREEKDRVRAEKEEDDKRWAAARRKRPSIGTSNDVPFNVNDFQPLSGNADPALFDAGASSASPPRASSQFGALASPSTSPPGARTVWGTTAIASTAPTLAAERPPDGWLEGWEDELFAQQESAVIAETDPNNQTSGSGPSASKGGKKKKKGKITLMSTNSHRGA